MKFTTRRCECFEEGLLGGGCAHRGGEMLVVQLLQLLPQLLLVIFPPLPPAQNNFAINDLRSSDEM